jgi:OOP family OmpA-OmpF porin
MNLMPRISRLAVMALPALTLMACADTHVDRMNQSNLGGGDAFTGQLARNYKDLSNYEAYQMYDWPDAVNYADKAMAVGKGQAVQPEDPTKWHIKGTDKQAELLAARQRLMAGLANGSTTRVPVDAAYAQSNYDCWVEQQSEGWQFDHIQACKNGFMRAIQVVETRQTTQQTQPAPAATGPFLVFFDWDKSTLTDDARRVLDQIAQRERNSTQAIHLIGHADRSGPDTYNMKLSQRRADSTKAYLVSHGIAASRITTEARGERDPLIQTADGVREPQNRRVAINLMTRLPGA